MDGVQREIMTTLAAAASGGTPGVRLSGPGVDDAAVDRAVQDLEARGFLRKGILRPELTPHGWNWVKQSTE